VCSGPEVYVIVRMAGEVRIVELKIWEQRGQDRSRSMEGREAMGEERGGRMTSFAVNKTKDLLYHRRERCVGGDSTVLTIVAVLGLIISSSCSEIFEESLEILSEGKKGRGVTFSRTKSLMASS
jgi:hypothetical protein